MKRRDPDWVRIPAWSIAATKAAGAAVHDRNFRAVDFDRGIVDAHAPQRSKHVLGGGNQRTFAVAQHGGEFSGDHGLG